jgi:hypothetical protein
LELSTWRAYIELVRRRNSTTISMNAMRRLEAIHPTAFKCNTCIHKMGHRMNDYRAIENQIRNARLEQSRDLGESIASVIFAAWTGTKHAAKVAIATIDSFVKAPDSYSTAMPRHF